MTADKCEQVEARRRRPSIPMPKFPRIAMMVIIATLLVGQVATLSELGVYADHSDLYEATVYMLLAWGIWPQIRYVINRVMETLATYIEDRLGESDV